ncbi:Protein CSN-2 [Aphelenchoides avenae]|nr:Protein CSN-2 [Aphelenchus avenae]
MTDDSVLDYASESEAECELEGQYYSTKEVSTSVGIEEAIQALEIVVEMDAEKTKWGFKALKQIAKLLLRKDQTRVMDNYGRLLVYRGSKHITSNDMDKAFDSLWNRYCEIVTDADARRSYCLTTLSLLQSFPSRLTRLKWLARLAHQCSSEEHHRQLDHRVDELQQVTENTSSMHCPEMADKLGHFAAAELCSALLRNRMSHRMAPDNWVDTFACLSQWDVDGFHFVGRRLSDFVDNNSRVLPLKNIAKVSLKTVTEEHAFGVRLTVQAESGSAPFCKEYSQGQTPDSFTTLLQPSVALRRVQNLLANAFVKTLDLTDTFPFAWYSIDTTTDSSLHIQKLNHLFHNVCHPRLLPMQAFGDVRVDHVEVRFTNLKEETRDFFGPLGNAQVTRLDVKFAWVRSEAEQAAFLALCFDGHSDGPTPHFFVQNARVARDFLQRMGQKARGSLYRRDIYIEMQRSPDENFVQLRTDFAEGTKERSGPLRIFRFDWPTKSLRIEVEGAKLVALYTPKQYPE